jgi:hypothetical protein
MYSICISVVRTWTYYPLIDGNEKDDDLIIIIINNLFTYIAQISNILKILNAHYNNIQ